MSDTDKMLVIDIRVGGLGDIWMRSSAFYSVVELVPSPRVELVVPEKMLNFLEHVFGDRLSFTADESRRKIAFSNRGIRDLLVPSLSGQRFVLPYARAVIRDSKTRTIKQRLNSISLSVFDFLGRIQVPPSTAIDEYQGYLELVGLRAFRDLRPEHYYDQAKKDFPVISARCLRAGLPTSEGFELPSELTHSTLVFPSGTSRTFVPGWWSKKHLPNAMFAFFAGDDDRMEYEKLGLRMTYFLREPGDIIELARHARRVIATDSFCSHLVQYTVPHATILLTELSQRRIVAPSFQGNVVGSLAPCHPCLKKARGSSPECQAGYAECLNWSNESYAANLPLVGGV